MSCALISEDLDICQGKTFKQLFAWESDQIVFKAITDITKTAPPVITAASHGLVNNWRAAVRSVRGMREINAEDFPPKEKDFHPVTTNGANEITLPIDAINFGRYTGGGTLIYYSPVDLDDKIARLSIKDKYADTTANLWAALTDYAEGDYIVLADSSVLECTTAGMSGSSEPTEAGDDGSVTWSAVSNFRGSRELLRLTTENGGIVLDDTEKTITVLIQAEVTAALTFKRGVYDMEMEDEDGLVTAFANGKINVHNEVTT
jgi:hypothetical protein